MPSRNILSKGLLWLTVQGHTVHHGGEGMVARSGDSIVLTLRNYIVGGCGLGYKTSSIAHADSFPLVKVIEIKNK